MPAANDINPTTGKAYAVRPDGVWDDNYFSKTYGGASSGGGGSQEDTIKRAIEMQREANKPAVQSLEAGIPEIQQGYQQQRQQLEAEKSPLKDRYDNLLNSIKGNQTTAENRQTVTTRNELGRRGITGDSGLFEQTVTNAVNPITQQYTGMYKDTALQGDSAMRDLVNRISNTSTAETAETRAVRNAIAQLQSGAASAGITQGLGQFQYQQQRDDQKASQEAQARAAEQENALKQLIYQTIQLPESQYATNKPYYKATTGGSSGGGSNDPLGLGF